MTHSDKIELTEDERDCLQELMNIAFGTATAAIAKIIDKFATLSIPKVETISSSDLREHLINKLKKSDSFYMASQLINGDIAGENLFIIDKSSGYNLACEIEDEEDIDEAEIKDIILEITNIISTSTSGKLADLVEASMSFNSPTINFINSINEYDNQFNCTYENIIIISTELKFDDQNINGELILMTKKDSSIYLKKALNSILEDF